MQSSRPDENDYTSVIVTGDAPILKAIELINESTYKLVLVCDTSGVLQGVITDGDIRRAILAHTSLEASVSLIMCKTPTYAFLGTPTREMIALMESKKIQALPILDKFHRVVGIETYMHAASRRQVQKSPVFLMAGGFGTRLRPLTQNCPKPLLKIGPRPLLESILLSFVEHGFDTFYISIHYLGDQVKEYFGDGRKWGVSITYVEETSPLGTAGALSLIKEPVSAPVIVMNGDLLTKVDFRALLDFHESTHASATMCVREYTMQVPYGVIELDGSRIVSIKEKPEHHYFVNAGIYVLSPNVVNGLTLGERVDMPDLMTKQVELGESVSTFPLHEYWLDIGRLGDFERAQQEFIEYFN